MPATGGTSVSGPGTSSWSQTRSVVLTPVEAQCKYWRLWESISRHWGGKSVCSPKHLLKGLSWVSQVRGCTLTAGVRLLVTACVTDAEDIWWVGVLVNPKCVCLHEQPPTHGSPRTGRDVAISAGLVLRGDALYDQSVCVCMGSCVRPPMHLQDMCATLLTPEPADVKLAAMYLSLGIDPRSPGTYVDRRVLCQTILCYIISIL